MKRLLLICLSAALALSSSMSLFAKSIPEEEWEKVFQQENRRASQQPFSLLGIISSEVIRKKAQTQAKDKMDLHVKNLITKWGKIDGERFKKNFLKFFPAIQKAFEANPLFKGYVLAVLDDTGGLEQQDYEKLTQFFKGEKTPSYAYQNKGNMLLIIPNPPPGPGKFENLEIFIYFQNKTVIVFKRIYTL